MSQYVIDFSHSELAFSVRHMMFAKVRGQFSGFRATLELDPETPAKSSVLVEVDTKSVDTREPQRDAHLRSADFFDSERFPSMTFKSRSVEATGKGRYHLKGELTIRDVTRELTLEVEETGRGKDPWGKQRVGYSVKGSLQRGDFGLRWNQALETGGVLVSDRVEIEAEVQVVPA